jgi:hypothetical protein
MSPGEDCEHGSLAPLPHYRDAPRSASVCSTWRGPDGRRMLRSHSAEVGAVRFCSKRAEGGTGAAPWTARRRGMSWNGANRPGGR